MAQKHSSVDCLIWHVEGDLMVPGFPDKGRYPFAQLTIGRKPYLAFGYPRSHEKGYHGDGLELFLRQKGIKYALGQDKYGTRIVPHPVWHTYELVGAGTYVSGSSLELGESSGSYDIATNVRHLRRVAKLSKAFEIIQTRTHEKKPRVTITLL